MVTEWASRCDCVCESAPLKSQKRTLEKIWRSYDGHAEAVTDLVRSTIAADTVEQVHAAFRVIMANANVHLVKNRFDPEFDGKATMGYRDLHLQLTLDDSRNTPYEDFVFEVQIHLKDLLALKSNSGHECYIKLRNLIGD